ncbi:MAG: alpha/beta hydrolase [Jannaschia sp.]
MMPMLTIDGTDLEYASHGPGSGPAIVLLHEGLGSVSLWRDWPERIAAATGWRVVAYSRAGYGRSCPATLPRPVTYMTQEANDVLPRVLDALAIDACILLGHSDGATIAAIHAGSTADTRVRGLILMAPHFFPEPEGLAAIARARESFETGDLRDRLARHHADPDAAFRGWNDVWLSPDFADWHVGEVIDYLRVPTLVIQGDADPYGTLAQVREVEERAYAPVDTLILPGAGHDPLRDAPDATFAAIVEFTARLARIEAEVVVPA